MSYIDVTGKSEDDADQLGDDFEKYDRQTPSYDDDAR